MRQDLKRLFTNAGVALACVTGLASGTALAAEEHILILLDRTGSMISTSTGGRSRMEIAKRRIESFVSAVPPPGTTYRYAFWTFAGTSYTPVYDFSDSASPAQIIAAANGVYASGNTPLAGSICSAIDSLLDFMPTDLNLKRLYLVTDGEENTTPSIDQCHGPWSAGTWPNLTTGSWQWKVRNKACTGIANAPGPCEFPPPYPPGLTLIADIDYLFTDNIPLRGEEAPNELFGERSLTAAPAGAAAVAELAFFQGLAQETGGRYQSITQQTPPTQAQPLPGDANLNGCVDVTDRSLVLSKYNQRVPAGDPADFNRNLVIDTGDYQTVLNNYGQGCSNPVPTRQ
ncbi:VWA domain-containing protein [Corallococcus macrosporus]|uniref:VWFA domain-containing protein n=1 Tax=Corallococcus macrosporus DSM 14697 TaxID=1189310 RepID=A0A250JWR1_9BACT|nr:VWA domain-containing protein [Corallococcus macrosporus]ATB48275.1 hypothetical protein MYMAC_003901 [Corallococcus macrosporus DSM 14697]